MFKKITKLLSNKYQLPRNYQLVTVLGKGVFGEVLQCIKVDTKEMVAVKVPQDERDMDDDVC